MALRLCTYHDWRGFPSACQSTVQGQHDGTPAKIALHCCYQRLWFAARSYQLLWHTTRSYRMFDQTSPPLYEWESGREKNRKDCLLADGWRLRLLYRPNAMIDRDNIGYRQSLPTFGRRAILYRLPFSQRDWTGYRQKVASNSFLSLPTKETLMPNRIESSR